ncbi:UNVERIFIED_ORG: hypothetical protein M2438_002085 [Methylobacterium sp. SuP10 SLI 274]|uniref:hypothetical protein n=1 Tax=Methylorubrum extorquens TaxID=408 RepID=UPI0020A127F0|nr:hypothetical protein [Methylorubrum extorquens]MDF9863300.1 hypothetical protein [Methylorubrum pseudosasae]MDH6636910.1 hypothetical protein [Methylobacterium sp. SuP10 SLI 274]MDH6666087.1 hypothetical protein [Methylorubrum zatmanii]MCP1558002.1 hypothetical protein [Methylorubrum extorquens]MDF9791611.1 hypothetical protein [Methylorubrum extorquens]
MSDRRAVLAALLSLTALPALAAEDGSRVEPVALPFAVKAMRGPGSDVALSVATSGLLPVARAPAGASADPKATGNTAPPSVVVVWGEGGGAVLSLDGDRLRTTLIGAEAIEGFAAAETPRGAVPGSRRALDGPLSAYFTGPTRALGGAPGQGTVLTVRERQPVGVTAEPKAVPVTTQTLAPGDGRVFAGRTPHITRLDGRPVVAAVTAQGPAVSGLAVAAKGTDGVWTLRAQTPPQAGKGPEGAPLALAAVADFTGTGTGQPQIAAIRAPDGEGVLQLWRIADGTLNLVGEAPGYAGPAAGEAADLAAPVPRGGGAPPDLALPVAGRGAVAVVSLKGGSPVERARLPLPAPAAHGVAVLDAGGTAKTILVGLADGRLVAVSAP